MFRMIEKNLPRTLRKYFNRKRLIAERRKTAWGYITPRIQQIEAWLINSKETTNFTYDLTDENILFLALTVSAVTGTPPRKILEYIQEARSDEALKRHVAERTAASPLRDTADQTGYFGRRLGWYAFVRALRPEILVETGVDKGLGSVLLCAALRRNQAEGSKGLYYGTDINPEAGFLLSGPYQAYGKILYGDSIKSLERLEDKIDLFINDSDHSSDYEYREYRTVDKKLSPRGVILGDNSHCSNALARFSMETGRKFLFFHEMPRDHWYPGAGIGISYSFLSPESPHK